MSTKKNTKSAVTEATPVGGAAPMPAVGAPPVPGDGAKPVISKVRNLQVLRSLIDAAPRAAEEVSASTVYASIFGERLPPAGVVANALTFSAEWAEEVIAARQWLSYASEQSTLAWTYTEGLIERLRPMMESAGAEIASDLPSLATVLGARAAVGKRAAQTRKRLLQAKKGETATSAAPSTTPAAAAATSEASAPVVVATPSTATKAD